MDQDAERGKPEELGPPWTILKILKWTTQFFASKGTSPSARLDAELLLAHVLGFERVKLYTNFDRPMSASELSAFRALIKRRALGEPVAYLVGSRGFWDFDLKTDRRALIPRPETEVLVELALKLLPADSDASFIDVGTGTGAIALAVARERPSLRVAASDISSAALSLARENADALGLSERVAFFEGDLFCSVDPSYFPAQMIASNPPYIAASARDTLMPDVKDFEPETALFSGVDGLDIIRRLVPAAFAALASGGYFLCEIGFDQGPALREILADAGFVDVAIRQDYARLDRVALGRKP